MKRKSRASLPNLPKTQAEIDALLEQYSSLKEMGYSNQQIADDLKISHSTLYRWARAKADARTVSEMKARPADYNVNQSISILCGPKTDQAEYVSAIAFFISWLRWPAFPELHETGALTVSMRYIREQTAATYIHELTAPQRAIFERFIRIDDIIKLTSLDGPTIPYLNEFYVFGQNYTDRDVIADVANYILAAHFDESRSSSRPSLNKAFHLIENGGFNRSWPFSKTSFQKLWRAYGQASPFLFVENYGPSLEWLIEPTASDFAQAFAGIENNPEEIRSFMSKAKWATGEIKRRLDRRAVANIIFPDFPGDLPETPIKPRGLNPKANFLLKAYSSIK